METEKTAVYGKLSSPGASAACKSVFRGFGYLSLANESARLHMCEQIGSIFKDKIQHISKRNEPVLVRRNRHACFFTDWKQISKSIHQSSF